jgi:hypothetical protein
MSSTSASSTRRSPGKYAIFAPSRTPAPSIARQAPSGISLPSCYARFPLKYLKQLQLPPRKSDRVNKVFSFPGMDAKILVDRNQECPPSVLATGGQESEPLETFGQQPQTRVAGKKNFFIWIRCNPLKSPDSAKGIQGNPSLFPWFYLVFLGFICRGLAIRLWRRAATTGDPLSQRSKLSHPAHSSSSLSQ